MRPCCRKAKHCFHSSQITSHCMTNTYHSYINFFFPLFLTYQLWLSCSHLFVYLCPPPCLSHSHSHKHMERRRCAALWQQPVSSVNDLWSVSRCVSLGSFRFVSTALYLRAPFMGPQVWLPSPWGGCGGGGCQIPPLPPWRTVMESPWAWWGNAQV